MFDLFQRLFGRESQSGKVAKERLQLVLVHDRANLSPQVLENLKEDLIRVISDYMDIDRESMEVNFSREDEGLALVASIPVRDMRRQAEG